LSITEQIKGLARHSSVYTISTFIQRALGLVMLPIYTDVTYITDRSAYGDLSLAYMFIAFLNVFYLYGMDSALLRYFFLGEYKQKDVYKTALIGVSVNSLFLTVIMFVFAPFFGNLIFGHHSYDNFIWYIALILLFDGIGNLPYLILRAEEKSVTYSTIRVGRFFLELLLNILFVIILRMQVKGILYANILASLINLLVLFPYQTKYMNGVFDKALFKTLLWFGLPLLPNGLAYLTVQMSATYLMSLLLDKDTLAVFSASYKFGSIFLFIVMAFRTAWQPFFLKVAKQANAKDIYSKIMTYFILLGILIIIGGSLLIEYLVKLPLFFGRPFMGEHYWSGLKIIPIILTAYLFYGIYVNLTVGVFIEKKTNLMIIFTGLAAIVNVVGNIYMMPAYGIMGAAWVTLLSYLIMAASIFIANQRIYPVPYDYARIGILFIILTIVLILYYVFSLSILLRILILAVVPIILFISGFFNPRERMAFKSVFKR
jgi:O-antigen/teichoic acid export membrane protein